MVKSWWSTYSCPGRDGIFGRWSPVGECRLPDAVSFEGTLESQLLPKALHFHEVNRAFLLYHTYQATTEPQQQSQVTRNRNHEPK